MAVHLVVDSTGLKIFGEGEWLAQKHKIEVGPGVGLLGGPVAERGAEAVNRRGIKPILY